MKHPVVDRSKRSLLLFIWACTLLLSLLDTVWLHQLAAITLAVYVIMALLDLRRETLIILLLITVLSSLLLFNGASFSALLDGLDRTLVFAALLPTLQLTRATARRLSMVLHSQQRLQNLPDHQADMGLMFGSQAFGSILNTGAFALMASVIADEAGPKRRRAAALASLRGMNTAALWSPFFVGFAVANTYLPAVPLWQIMPLGLSLVMGGMLLALSLFARPLSWRAVKAALYCLQPIMPGLGLAALAVLVCSLLTSLSTLTAVLLVMPLLCLVVMAYRPATAAVVRRETYAGIGRLGDDLALISAAMMLGTLAESAPIIQQSLALWLNQTLPPALVTATVVGVMTMGGIVGLHPMITGTVLMVGFTGSEQAVADLVLMQAMLLGWALASMNSVSSLSVITAGAMYRVPPLRLAFSPNLWFAGLFALFSVLLLSVIDWLLG